MSASSRKPQERAPQKRAVVLQKSPATAAVPPPKGASSKGAVKDPEKAAAKATGASPNIKKGIARLIELGRERGYVTYEDISRIAPTDDLLPEDLKSAVSILTENDIEIVEIVGAKIYVSAKANVTFVFDTATRIKNKLSHCNLKRF